MKKIINKEYDVFRTDHEQAFQFNNPITFKSINPTKEEYLRENSKNQSQIFEKTYRMIPSSPVRFFLFFLSNLFLSNTVAIFIIAVIFSVIVEPVNSLYKPVAVGEPFKFWDMDVAAGMTQAIKGGWFMMNPNAPGLGMISQTSEFSSTKTGTDGISYYTLALTGTPIDYAYMPKHRWVFIYSVYDFVTPNCVFSNLYTNINDPTTSLSAMDIAACTKLDAVIAINDAIGQRSVDILQQLSFQANSQVIYGKLFYAHTTTLVYDYTTFHNLMMSYSTTVRNLLPSYKINFDELNLTMETTPDIEEHVSKVTKYGYILNEYDKFYALKKNVFLGRENPTQDIDLCTMALYRIGIMRFDVTDEINFGFWENDDVFYPIFKFADSTFTTKVSKNDAIMKVYSIKIKMWFPSLWTSVALVNRKVLVNVAIHIVTLKSPDYLSFYSSSFEKPARTTFADSATIGELIMTTFGIMITTTIDPALNPLLLSEIYVQLARRVKGGTQAGAWCSYDEDIRNWRYGTLGKSSTDNIVEWKTGFVLSNKRWFDTSSEVIPLWEIPRSNIECHLWNTQVSMLNKVGYTWSSLCDITKFFESDNGTAWSTWISVPTSMSLSSSEFYCVRCQPCWKIWLRNGCEIPLDGYLILEVNNFKKWFSDYLEGYYRDYINFKYVLWPPDCPNCESMTLNIWFECLRSFGCIENNTWVNWSGSESFDLNKQYCTTNLKTRFIDWNATLTLSDGTGLSTVRTFTITISLLQTKVLFEGMTLPANVVSKFKVASNSTITVGEPLNYTIEFTFGSVLPKSKPLVINLSLASNDSLSSDSILREVYLVHKEVQLLYYKKDMDQLDGFANTIVSLSDGIVKALALMTVLGGAITPNFGISFIKLFQLLQLFGKLYFIPIQFSIFMDNMVYQLYSFSNILKINKDILISDQKDLGSNRFKLSLNLEDKYILRQIALPICIYASAKAMAVIFIILGKCCCGKNNCFVPFFNNMAHVIIQIFIVDFWFYGSLAMAGPWDYKMFLNLKLQYIVNLVVSMIFVSLWAEYASKFMDIALNFERYEFLPQYKRYTVLVREGLGEADIDRTSVLIMNPILPVIIIIYQAMLVNLQNFSHLWITFMFAISTAMTVHFVFTLIWRKPFTSYFESIPRFSLVVSLSVISIICLFEFLNMYFKTIPRSSLPHLEIVLFITIFLTLFLQSLMIVCDGVMGLSNAYRRSNQSAFSIAPDPDGSKPRHKRLDLKKLQKQLPAANNPLKKNGTLGLRLKNNNTANLVSNPLQKKESIKEPQHPKKSNRFLYKNICQAVANKDTNILTRQHSIGHSNTANADEKVEIKPNSDKNDTKHNYSQKKKNADDAGHVAHVSNVIKIKGNGGKKNKYDLWKGMDPNEDEKIKGIQKLKVLDRIKNIGLLIPAQPTVASNKISTVASSDIQHIRTGDDGKIGFARVPLKKNENKSHLIQMKNIKVIDMNNRMADVNQSEKTMIVNHKDKEKQNPSTLNEISSQTNLPPNKSMTGTKPVKIKPIHQINTLGREWKAQTKKKTRLFQNSLKEKTHSQNEN